MSRITVIDGSLAERRVHRLEVVNDVGEVVTIQHADIIDADGTTALEIFRYFSADFSIGAESHIALGSTGSYLNRRTLTAVLTGGTGPFTYAWSEDDSSGTMTLGSPTASNTFATSTTFVDEPGTGSITANVTLNVTDTSNGQVAMITRPVELSSAF